MYWVCSENGFHVDGHLSYSMLLLTFIPIRLMIRQVIELVICQTVLKWGALEDTIKLIVLMEYVVSI